MPSPFVVLDRVEDAQIVVDKGRYIVTRTGMVYDLNTTLAPASILASALGATGMPPEGDPWPPFPDAKLTRRIVDTIKGINTKAKLLLTYEQRGPGGAVTFVLTRDKQLVQTVTELHPKDKAPMRFRWFNPSDTAQREPYTNAKLPYLKPIKSLIATGYIIGAIPAGIETAFGTVNDAPWQGYPKGYWLFTGDGDITQDYGNSFNVRLEFLNNVNEDWSSWAVFQDKYGNSMPVDPADTAALKAMAYSYGFNRTKNGILKAGLYDLSHFNTLFGF